MISFDLAVGASKEIGFEPNAVPFETDDKNSTDSEKPAASDAMFRLSITIQYLNPPAMPLGEFAIAVMRRGRKLPKRDGAGVMLAGGLNMSRALSRLDLSEAHFKHAQQKLVTAGH